jgi:DNA (cytosine-5)-methyltransferase 1
VSRRDYYNEIDPYAARTLRNLIEAGELPPGDVDERSIEDVLPCELRGYRRCHFFAGIGGWALALLLAEVPDELEAWTASTPCQPFSAQGSRAGLADERHLWPAYFHLVSQCRPARQWGEQVEAAIAHEWLDLVRSDLEGEGFAFWPEGLPAACIGAPHNRPRLFWTATDTQRHQQSRREPRRWPAGRVGRIEQSIPWHEPWPSALSRFRVLGDGLPRNVDATDAARNAIVPQVAARFIQATMTEAA